MALPTNSLPFISGIRPKRRVVAPRVQGRAVVGLVDMVFLRALGKRFVCALSLFLGLIFIFGAMSGSLEEKAQKVEGQNYELLTTNLQLKSEKTSMVSFDHVQGKVEEFGLFPQEKWQSRKI